MASNFDSNITNKLMRKFLPAFESKRVLSKNVNTQLFDGKYDPSTGDTISIKRPTDYKSSRTAAGDISGGTAQSIITGKAHATVQNYITVEVDWTEADQAIKMDQLEELIAPAAARIVTDLEVDFASFMLQNSGLLSGTYGTAVSTWDHVALAGATLEANGIPKDGMWNYVCNPYTQTTLASNQRSLGAGGAAGSLINDAVKNATVSENFAGMRVMTGTTLDTVTLPTMADMAGVIAAAGIDITYATAKDTMTQTIAISGVTGSVTIPAGAVVEVTGRYRNNLSTRKPVINASGAQVVWTGVVTADAVVAGGGTASIVVSGPAIYEATGAYNTTTAAVAAGDVITIKGTSATTYQPNLFWHKNAFAIASVPIQKLYSTDTVAQTSDGLQLRISKGASIRENKQIVRFDLRPAYGVLNPFFAGQSFGTA